MTDLSPWGVLLAVRREQDGLSIREAARLAHLGDSYWGQIERGWAQKGGRRVEVVPSLGKLLQCARALRMSEADTEELVAAAGYEPLPVRPAGRSGGVNVEGLDAAEVRALNALADRLRARA